MDFSVKVVPWQAQKLEIGICGVFLPFEVICRPAPTRISEIRICGTQIFSFYTKCDKKLIGQPRKKKINFCNFLFPQKNRTLKFFKIKEKISVF
jgi:hypothetical protein